MRSWIKSPAYSHLSPHAPGLILCDATGGNPRWWRWRSERNLLATRTWRCAQGRQMMTLQSPFLRRLGTCSQLGHSSPRPHRPPSFPLHTDWILMMCSHPLADKLLKPRLPAFCWGPKRRRQSQLLQNLSADMADHGLHGALIFLASKTLVLSLFSSYHFWATPFLCPSLVASTTFPCKSGCLQRPSPPLSSVFASEII